MNELSNLEEEIKKHQEETNLVRRIYGMAPAFCPSCGSIWINLFRPKEGEDKGPKIWICYMCGEEMGVTEDLLKIFD